MADIKPKTASPPPKQPEPPKQEPQIPASLLTEIEEIMRRLRLLEERYSGLRKKDQFNEQNMLKETKDIFEEINMIHSTVSELKSEISELKEKLGKLSEEVGASAKKTDFNVLSKYLDFWQPLNFLTRQEAEKIIQELKDKKY